MTLPKAPYDFNDDIQIVDTATPCLWQQWRVLSDAEGWNGIDHSVGHLIPLLSSARCVMAVSKRDKTLVGSVIWNEYAGERLAYVTTYVIAPEMRGKGVGSAIWERAMQRIKQNPDDYTIGLASVLAMADKYAAAHTPVLDRKKFAYKLNIDVAIDKFFEQLQQNERTTLKRVQDLSSSELEQVLQFDHQACGRDRSEMLRLHWRLECVEGFVLFAPSGDIVSLSGLCSTGLPEQHLWRVGPIYASTLPLAAATVVPLLQWIRDNDPHAIIIIHMFTETKGASLLNPLLSEHCVVSPKVMSVRQYSRPFPPTSDGHHIIAPHAHCGYLDM